MKGLGWFEFLESDWFDVKMWFDRKEEADAKLAARIRELEARNRN